jgi:hypothetical protein
MNSTGQGGRGWLKPFIIAAAAAHEKPLLRRMARGDRLAKMAQKRVFLQDFGLFISRIAGFVIPVRRILPSRTLGKNRVFRSFGQNISTSKVMVRIGTKLSPWATCTFNRRLGDSSVISHPFISRLFISHLCCRWGGFARTDPIRICLRFFRSLARRLDLVARVYSREEGRIIPDNRNYPYLRILVKRGRGKFFRRSGILPAAIALRHFPARVSGNGKNLEIQAIVHVRTVANGGYPSAGPASLLSYGRRAR